MPSWLLGEEEEEEEQVKAGGFFPAFPQRLKSVGGLGLSLSLSRHLTECGGGCVIICCSRKNEKVGGGWRRTAAADVRSCGLSRDSEVTQVHC